MFEIQNFISSRSILIIIQNFDSHSNTILEVLGQLNIKARDWGPWQIVKSKYLGAKPKNYSFLIKYEADVGPKLRCPLHLEIWRDDILEKKLGIDSQFLKDSFLIHLPKEENK